MTDRVLVVDFDLQREEEDELLVRATVHNHGPRDLVNWSLKFDLPKQIRARDFTVLRAQVGSHVTLAPTDESVLPTQGCVELMFSGAVSMIQRLSDLPRGLYVSGEENATLVHLPAALGNHNLESIATGRMIPSTYGGVAATPAAASSSSAETGFPSATDSVTDLCGIVPRPSQTQRGDGSFSCAARLCYHGCAPSGSASTWLADVLPVELSQGDKDSARLRFEADPELADEAYHLKIETDGITISAADERGFFNAAASLLQLSDLAGPTEIRWPCVVIDDQPRFHFRGLMLDCARHFHAKETVLRTLDLMAQYKFNHFHWHLTDDEGWRVEIQAFPELTERGAWRGEGEVLESQFGTGPGRYGGFYTREDVLEVVEYAAARQIQVIPEIDIPGHSRAAIRSCPELLVEEADSSQYCGAQLYTDNVLNPALPGTYQFLHAVLDEICDLFPGRYVHLGVDEVPEGVWEQSPACRDFMVEHDYQSAHELQGHLLRDLQGYLADKGKQLMGWEEAVRGDKLDHTAIVNAWSGVPVATELANAGYGVVACAAPFAYLDLAWDDNAFESGYYWAGTCDLPACYGYEPATPALTEEGASHFAGVEAVLWSELVSSSEQLEYMLFPRLLAMAETAWTSPSDKDWVDFYQRMPRQMARLDQCGVNHRPLEESC
jgi:hexosaminidase